MPQVFVLNTVSRSPLLTAFHYFQYFPSSVHQVSEFDHHIGIHQFCHWNYVLFGLVEITGNMLRGLSVAVKVSEIADPVGTFK